MAHRFSSAGNVKDLRDPSKSAGIGMPASFSKVSCKDNKHNELVDTDGGLNTKK